jgi:hypothetical protein
LDIQLIDVTDELCRHYDALWSARDQDGRKRPLQVVAARDAPNDVI